jgi:hypothetical protein
MLTGNRSGALVLFVPQVGHSKYATSAIAPAAIALASTIGMMWPRMGQSRAPNLAVENIVMNEVSKEASNQTRICHAVRTFLQDSKGRNAARASGRRRSQAAALTFL